MNIDASQEIRAAAQREAQRLQQSLGAGEPFAVAIHSIQMPFIVTAAFIDDNPIVFANEAFCQLTGYEQDEIIGINCRRLQGEGTDRRDVARLREATEEGKPIDLELLNYRKEGTSFLNALHVSPIRNHEGQVTYFMGTQMDVTEVRAKAAADAVQRERERQIELALEERRQVIQRLRSQAGDDPAKPC